MAKARVKWIEGKTLYGVDANGQGILITGGGEGPGPSPMQLLLLGLGGCSMLDVVSILHKQRQPLADVQVVVEGERGEEHPRPWKAIHMHFIVIGDGLDPHKVERAVNLSIEKYCGVHATLSGVTRITHDFEIRPQSIAEDTE